MLDSAERSEPVRGRDEVDDPRWVTQRPEGPALRDPGVEDSMAESVYKVIELVGTSTESWEKAASAAVKMAGKTLRDLRIAEIAELDMQLEDGKIRAYRARVKLSFKFKGSD